MSSNSMKPGLSSALPRKEESTYGETLTGFKTAATSLGIPLQPKTILIDFELAAYNAFSEAFPNAFRK
ncbi:unnamed protein product, partial [Didymodactylos carnosus]